MRRIFASFAHQQRLRRTMFAAVGCLVVFVFNSSIAMAQGDPADGGQTASSGLNFQEMVQAGGAVGIIIILLSVAMVALIVEHMMSIRRGALIPPGLADDVHKLIGEKKYKQADQQCKSRPGFLSRVLSAGLSEIPFGYASVEKSMESASHEQAARLFRKIEFLSVIGTIAPMLGLLGTVWGMILAFVEFESKANPQVSELAPGIYKALVTTLLGLGVAVPALGAFAIFRNRIDELVAEATLTAESVFVDFKRSTFGRTKSKDSSSSSARRTTATRDTRTARESKEVREQPGTLERPAFPPERLGDDLLG